MQRNAGGSQNDHLDLCIPRLRTLSVFADYPYTKVKLAAGVFEAISFEPATKFESVTKQTKEDFQRLNPFILAPIREEASSIRRTIDPSMKHENADFEDALNRLFASPPALVSIERSSSAVGSTKDFPAVSSGDVDDGLQYNNEVVSEPLEQPDTIYYTNTSSCGRINSKVFDLVERLIKYVRRDRHYLLLSQMQLSSEIGKRFEHLVPPKDFCNIVVVFMLVYP